MYQPKSPLLYSYSTRIAVNLRIPDNGHSSWYEVYSCMQKAFRLTDSGRDYNGHASSMHNGHSCTACVLYLGHAHAANGTRTANAQLCIPSTAIDFTQHCVS